MASQHWGGAEKVFVEVANELSKKHEIIALLLRDTEYADKFSPDVHTVTLRSHPTRHNPFQLWELYTIIKNCNADIIHTHAVKATELIFTISRLFPLNHLGTKHNARKGKIFNRLRWVTAVSREAVESVQQIKGGIIKLIHNGIIPRETESFPKNDIFSILAVGRLDKIKGFDILIGQLRNLPFEFKLSIVGEGKEAENLQKLIDHLGVENAISLDGFCDDVPNLMRRSDLVVISSHSEGFPKVMVEALFYANVLVSTPVGGVMEVIPPLFLAQHDQLGGKIQEIHENYSHYLEQFKRVKDDNAESFTLDKIILKYESFYQEIVK